MTLITRVTGYPGRLPGLPGTATRATRDSTLNH
jgi:hypothetical protein